MKPNTPLPWDEFLFYEPLNSYDSEYAARACNAYPKLVEFLVSVSVGLSGNHYLSSDARSMLQELGEL